MAEKQVNTLDALAIATHAFDINACVVKQYDEEKLIPNVVYVRDYFGLSKEVTTPTVLISPDLLERAQAIKTWVEHNITMSLLKQGHVNDFQKLVAEIIDNESVNVKHLGILVWAPKLYHDQIARDSVREHVMQISYRSNWIGKEKERVNVDCTLLEKRFHSEYNSWTAFGHDQHNNLVRFMTKHEHLCASHKITGKVKDQGTERYHNNGKITTLNFVKAI